MLKNWEKPAKAIINKRNIKKQWQDIEDNYSHATISALTSSVLSAHNIINFKDTAENCVILGCYRPFDTPKLIRDSMDLLDMLKIEYMRLPNEYCCGATIAIQSAAIYSKTDDIKTAKDKGKSFISKNVSIAQEKGAKRMIYCCAGCAHAAKDSFPDSAESHIYILDFILDNINKLKLKSCTQTIGYFEGCHSYAKALYPKGTLNWARYKDFLTNISGIKIFDITKGCCRTSAKDIVMNAKEAGCSQIVSPCSGCYPVLRTAGNKIIPVYSMQEFIVNNLI